MPRLNPPLRFLIPPEIRLSSPAEKVVQMSRQRSNDRSILKFIGTAHDPFEIGSAARFFCCEIWVSRQCDIRDVGRDGQLRGMYYREAVINRFYFRRPLRQGALKPVLYFTTWRE